MAGHGGHGDRRLADRLAVIGSLRPGRRFVGFCCFLLSNLLWVIWGWHAEAWALIVLQVCLAAMNIRGVKKNDDPAQPEPDTPRA